MIVQRGKPEQLSLQSKELPFCLHGRVPLIYGEHYDLSLPELERHLPLDLKKRGRVFESLVERFHLDRASTHRPLPVSDDELSHVHTARYLASLKHSAGVAEAFGLPLLASLPFETLLERLVTPLRSAVGGTLAGVTLAEQCGWAVNLSGGFHHAEPDRGGGFCLFNDILLAAHLHVRDFPAGSPRVLVVDVDAHQSNGVARGFAESSTCSLLDVYNEAVYPRDRHAAAITRYPVPVPSDVSDLHYLDLVFRSFMKAVLEVQPTLLIYVAGADVVAKDPLGKMRLRPETVIERDVFVTQAATRAGIPWLLLLGGGYGGEAHSVISSSLSAIFQQFKGIDQVRPTIP